MVSNRVSPKVCESSVTSPKPMSVFQINVQSFAVSWCKKRCLFMLLFFFLGLKKFVHQELKQSWKALIHVTQRMQRLIARWSISVSDHWSWHFTDGSRAVSDDSCHWLTGQLAFATRVYLTGCDKVIYGGIKTELARTMSPQVNVAFNS